MRATFIALILRAVVAALLIPWSSPAADVVINEFVAVNNSTLTNSLGETSDWIELYNPTTNTQNLAGWFLTDDDSDLTQWRLPATNIYAGGFMLIYASDHGFSITNGELHAPFSLKSSGEYLGLCATDGVTVVSEYAPAYSEQRSDIAYGLIPETATAMLVSPGSPCHYLVPADGGLGTNWIEKAFDDSSWGQGTTALGYEVPVGTFSNQISTTVPVGTRGLYARFDFDLTNGVTYDRLALQIQSDDGFVAYLDGRRIASRNAPASPIWNSSATATIDNADAITFAEFEAAAAWPALSAGHHVLAVHALNAGVHPLNSDLLLHPVLATFGRTGGVTESRTYLAAPTPGRPNSLVGAPLAERVLFSRPGGLITNAFLLTLSATSATAQVRYTLNGALPTESSSLYGAPILIGSNRHVRARVYDFGVAPGPVVSKSYLMLAPALRSFNSNLPLMVVDTLGVVITNEVGDFPERPVYTVFVDAPNGGRAALTNAPVHVGRGGMKVRGSTSSAFPKKSLRLETWDDADQDQNVALLGLPAESDWVLYASYFDKSLMRTPLVAKWYRSIDRYAPRTRYLELYMDQDNGMVTSNDYLGVYVLEERIEVGSDRVDITPLRATDNIMPNVSGGYILKFDRLDPGEGFLPGWTKGDSYLCYVDPDYNFTTVAQRNWILAYLQQFESALYGVNYKNLVSGYPAYADIPSFVDRHIFFDLCLDTDGYRHSTYLQKDRNGKLEMGPPWDSDHNVGNISNGYDPIGWWNYKTFSDHHYEWMERMLTDLDFYQALVDRWDVLLAGPLKLSTLLADIQKDQATLVEAAERNFVRWPILAKNVHGEPPGWETRTTYTSEVAYLSAFISNRVTWIATQFPAPPVLTPAGGLVASGTVVTATAGAGFTVYATSNGSDPRASGGAIAAAAQAWGASRTITSNTLWRVRTRNGSGLWSAPRTVVYLVTLPALAISEVMHHPGAPPFASPYGRDDFEFVEVKNIGVVPASLGLVTFTRGIDFTFSPATLPAGACAVVVRNRDAFASRYYTNNMFIAGVYTGALDNAGEELQLEASISGPVLATFRYEDQRGWPVAADGAGHSLVPLRTDVQSPVTLNFGGNWRASGYRGGSPGLSDPVTPPGAILNELVAHTDYSNAAMPEYDSNDQIELFNAAGTPQSLTNWYLSDDPDVLNKWALPAGATLAPRGWLALDETSGFHHPLSTGFGLNKAGESVFLSHLPGGGLDRVADAVAFKAQERDLGWGRIFDGGYWVGMHASMGGANTPRVGGVVITEIEVMPASATGVVDELTCYVEIQNPNATTTSCASVAGAWRVDGSGTCAFPAGYVLPPCGRALIVGFNPNDAAKRAAFTQRHGVAVSAAQLIGPLTPPLPSQGGRVAVESPLAPDLPGDSISWGIVDEAIFWSDSPWPAPGFGHAIHRRFAERSGNEVTNWMVGLPSPLSGTLANGSDLDEDGLVDAWERSYYGRTDATVGDPVDDGDGDGMNTEAEYIAGTDPTNAADRFVLSVIWSNATGVVSWWGEELEYGIYTNSQRLYALERATNVPAMPWLSVPGFTTISGENARVAYTNEAAIDAPQFYRARVWLD